MGRRTEETLTYLLPQTEETVEVKVPTWYFGDIIVSTSTRFSGPSYTCVRQTTCPSLDRIGGCFWTFVNGMTERGGEELVDLPWFFKN